MLKEHQASLAKQAKKATGCNVIERRYGMRFPAVIWLTRLNEETKYCCSLIVPEF
jgi:hypothetical protein